MPWTPLRPDQTQWYSFASKYRFLWYNSSSHSSPYSFFFVLAAVRSAIVRARWLLLCCGFPYSPASLRFSLSFSLSSVIYPKWSAVKNDCFDFFRCHHLFSKSVNRNLCIRKIFLLTFQWTKLGRKIEPKSWRKGIEKRLLTGIQESNSSFLFAWRIFSKVIAPFQFPFHPVSSHFIVTRQLTSLNVTISCVLLGLIQSTDGKFFNESGTCVSASMV